jgi:hypothetical protein
MNLEKIDSIKVIQVRQCILDEAVWGFTRFIKMDLEGGEFNALQGARRLIMRDRPFILFETSFDYSATTYKYKREQMFDLFFKHQYLLFDLFGRQFSHDQWEQPGCPWYLMAVSEFSSDEKYIRESHSHIVQSL